MTAFSTGSTGNAVYEWYCEPGNFPVLASASAGVQYRTVTETPWLSKANVLKRLKSPLEGQEQYTQVFRFSAGTIRNLGSIFSVIDNGKYDVVISDPYIAVNRFKRSKLQIFLLR